jgi:hypothetical protein
MVGEFINTTPIILHHYPFVVQPLPHQRRSRLVDSVARMLIPTLAPTVLSQQKPTDGRIEKSLRKSHNNLLPKGKAKAQHPQCICINPRGGSRE